MAFGTGLHRCHKRHLVLRAAASLAAGTPPAQVGIVDHDAPIEFAALFAPAHRFHDLVLEQPGAAIGHAQLALELQGRDVVLGLREQLHRQEPARQGQLGRLEHRAADQAALLCAVRALPVAQGVAHERGSSRPRARRALEAARPARRLQRRLALRFGSIQLQELRHRQSRLKLHSVHRHGAPPVSMRPSSAPHWLTK